MNISGKIFLLIITVLFTFVLNAQTEFSQLIKEAGTSSDYPKSDILMIFDSTTVDVQESGLSYFFIHHLYKVLTKKGAKSHSVVKFGYEPQSAFLEIQKVRIYKKDGTIKDVNVSNRLDYTAPGSLILWGAREQMVEVGRLEVGDAVEVVMFKKGYTYALLQKKEDDEDKYVPPMRGHYYDIVPFWSSNTVLTKVYRTIIPVDKHLQYRFYNGEVMPEVRLNGEKMVYSFTKRNISPFKSEPNMVSKFDVAPKLILTTSPDWGAKSRWFYNVNEDYGSFESTKEIKKKVDEILEGARDEIDSVSRLTHWVADEVRYFGLTMGKGEGYTLHKGEMTFRDRCGVCKDKAGMLVTMLRAAGFEAYAAMTMAGSRIEDIPADHFNHSVTAVRLSDGKLHMLDPTWVPFVRELWSSLEQQQNYIIGTEKGEDLEVIPVSPPENHYYKIFANSEIKADGALEGRFTLVAEGQSDATFRRYFVRSFVAYWDQILENELISIYPHMEISEIQYPDPYEYSDPITIKVFYKIPDYALVTGNEILFTPLIATELFKKQNYHYRINTKLEKRNYPFKDRCSKLIELKESITLPQYKSVIYVPKNSKSDGSGASFKAEYSIKENSLNFYEKIELKKRVYEVADWESFRKAIMLQRKFAEEKVILAF